MDSKLQHIILLVDEGAPSFCFYTKREEQTALMPLEALTAGIRFAEAQALELHVVYGKNPLPEAYQQLLKATPHVRILPFKEGERFGEHDIVVLHATPVLASLSLRETPVTHLILKIPVTDISGLYAFVESNYRLAKRISVIFDGIAGADENTLNELRLSLNRLRPLLYKIFKREELTEIGFVSDRILLTEMNNCNAGITHITLAPDGSFYICPGFYYNGDAPIGTCKDGITIKNSQLYQYDHASVCKRCDCYQCKRCVYLNKLTTLEVNTPSHAQCVVSHHERNLSGILLSKLHKQGLFINMPEITPLFHLDPVERFEK